MKKVVAWLGLVEDCSFILNPFQPYLKFIKIWDDKPQWMYIINFNECINILQRVVTTYEQFMIADANRVVKLVL